MFGWWSVVDPVEDALLIWGGQLGKGVVEKVLVFVAQAGVLEIVVVGEAGADEIRDSVFFSSDDVEGDAVEDYGGSCFKVSDDGSRVCWLFGELCSGVSGGVDKVVLDVVEIFVVFDLFVPVVAAVVGCRRAAERVWRCGDLEEVAGEG